jgi:aspartyl-tRNA synthetase
MERTYIKDLRSAIGQTVQINGWLQTLRDQKKLQFLIMRDPTGSAQVVHWKIGCGICFDHHR